MDSEIPTSKHKTALSTSILDGTFKTPSIWLVVGPTQSGKTEFVLNLLERRKQLFSPDFGDKIIWCYGQKSAFHKTINKRLKTNVLLHEGIPDQTFLDKNIKQTSNTGIVFDDLQQTITRSKDMLEMVLNRSHHEHLTIFIMLQNAFASGTTRVDLTRNGHYCVTFRSGLDQTLQKMVFNRFRPGFGDVLMSIMNDLQKEMTHPYLLLDGFPTTPEILRVRTQIFDNLGQHIFLLHNNQS